MRAGMRSRTAEAAAVQRALHWMRDDPPHVFVDDRVVRLLSPATRMWLRLSRRFAGTGTSLDGPAERAARLLRGQIVVRARYTEDRLESLLGHGLSQYVILSAGLDTFALRRTELADRLRVFEVDQIDTQRWKRSRMPARAPRNLRFVAVDFERESAGDALRRSDFDPTRPGFCSWLGTTYYLSNAAVMATLASLRGILAPGSEIVFDYWTRDPGSDWRTRMLLSGVRVAVAMQGEPMLSFFRPNRIERELSAIGFEVLENSSPEDLRGAYLRGRRDGLDVPEFAWILRLRVS